MVRAFLTFTDFTARIAQAVAMVLLYCFCAMMLAEVFSRGFLARSLAFSWEYSAFAMCGVFLLGLGPALQHGTQVRVSLLLSRGPRFARIVDIVATLIGLVLACLLLEAFWSVFQASFTRGLRQSSYMNTPLAIPQAVAVAGAVEFVLAMAARLLRLSLGMAPELERETEDG
ncbi:TRAP transporter small permease subunit [Martelella radicis]|uniref:TRAP transporter small permease protein n=1 Tax=Martelella radicis TaxID=1397476 RepID=A0A7W6P9U5_9HYPH|nr:TRAP transporter small permease [Martelella radicis]MBB4120909.1 TRAP-type C4-dicarboxylate transport system permease small subunit [Martelella radicis]